ncbi:spermidine/putrescine transport system ATP-binding protein [Clostridium acetobutylicum]|uniref:Spermidine/putrescine import ATP-binding protein PotA n=1 Tax=Clostridium acetobutylicum (strain ATCC 824 / DSM 792 / JCM 1419 / IAM 19013 / LMG 5710 / NBRC 13948 / NRRL B-527 / VKM B-1787 / 2291 / W) TaxID=272562 RepID=POTA_CLOAB|nr:MULTISPECIES: spermidine/putrescine ABC transporter ATP-binding protein [Clostridium]Q97KS6.1 RecName: Full=Spermidine/putrescine import ATP-binding protein PotA [Clostridium acetobutylicum ATCC 824]AAK78816.1 Spermidine/putrescine ABC transporter, ATP-binding component [Clostridium acetobutylicum ATCC 824]ADZ19890.1 Spermidine/putrescine ABC transporter, ATP-binding component [Clostridium acetobutylicum EA 2018]AEI33898.1 spermidine/putrescine ABC transporter ATP-binding protein [Clostridiu
MEKDILIELKNVSKKYGENYVIKNLNLFVRRNEFLTFLGPSGCGKTTTLNMIAGFETPDEGNIIFEDSSINIVPPHKRQINTVFQKYALFSHMNVYENVAFGLRIKKLPEKQIREEVEKMLSLVDLKGFEKRSTDSLSGGQQQRVAIARALVNKPKLLLLDEPLGALDLKLRKEMQLELKNIQQKLGITFIFVTHDQEEALTMSDTIVVLNKGTVQQIGTPEDIYNEPKNKFVANFIGVSNILNGVMLHDYKVKFDDETFDCVDTGFNENEDVDVVVRPEDIKIVSKENGKLFGKVISAVFRGVHYEIKVEVKNTTWIIHNTKHVRVGDSIGLDILPDDIHIMRKEKIDEEA